MKDLPYPLQYLFSSLLPTKLVTLALCRYLSLCRPFLLLCSCLFGRSHTTFPLRNLRLQHTFAVIGSLTERHTFQLPAPPSVMNARTATS
jgi:hypothetical protein